MELKKNPKADLNRNIGLYFAIGLAFVSGLMWAAIEYKTYDKVDDFNYSMDLSDELVEEVPMTMQLAPPPPPPPPPPVQPEIIDIVDDDEEIEEVEIQSTEVSKDTEVREVEEFVEVEEEEGPMVDVPFTVIEDKPMFPACKKKPKSKQAQCFKEKLDEHVRKTFNYPEIAQEMGIQGRVYVNFRINKDGTITVLGTRGPDKNLEKEAKRIIDALPKLIPGKQRGQPTPVTFAYPIVFRLN
ncbi:hypothetical protein NBRC110019_00500 [Neptunitalea chrysea]|uniref:TonB C-terminal domain-containing protein n=1 Tax=Neptunitalea chrysea TaxID=1647581 RepID=A0A9W6B2H4_9FLAO|nr:energy transducer TonB [Neptunitalea chrysea]GLB51011.1 hypothetical protein NBRC110019_00500 [Neptunitalea chrysea]